MPKGIESQVKEKAVVVPTTQTPSCDKSWCFDISLLADVWGE